MAARLTLASASPRRRELLRRLCADFDVKPSGLDETLDPGPLGAAVAALALKKARAVGAESSGVILGADTIVVIDGVVLGKPADAGDARRMLARLSGRTHDVITGVAVVDAGTGRSRTTTVVSRVHMARSGADVIDAYVGSGESFDKAGAYAIQGLGRELIVGVVGSYTNVIGLPLAATRQLLEQFDVPVRPEAVGAARPEAGRDGGGRPLGGS
jgi:septum formation protein